MFSTTTRQPRLHLVQRGVVLLLCLALGLQWALVQGIAWAEMFIDFASEGSVIEAVEKTFDGQHGCPLCRKIKEGSHHADTEGQTPEEDDSKKEPDAKDTAALLVGNTRIVPPAGRALSFAPLHAVLITRNEMPEPPPPRRGLA